MTTDELRKAAERMNRIAKAKLGTPMAAAAKAWVEDNWAVSTAWLAEHAADDAEPVKADCLEAVGFTTNDSLVYDYRSYARMEWFHFGDGLTWELLIGKSIFPDFDTRGQVRRLCAALGDPLKEQVK
jgi:hypothetical protein